MEERLLQAAMCGVMAHNKPEGRRSAVRFRPDKSSFGRVMIEKKVIGMAACQSAIKLRSEYPNVVAFISLPNKQRLAW